MVCGKRTQLAVAGGCGIVSLVLGLTTVCALGRIIYDVTLNMMILRNGTQVYGWWHTPPVPVFLKFYFFDVVNTHEVVHDGARPVLIQKGPYTYRERQHRDEVTFHDNGTVSYILPRYFYFDRERSAGPENDTFTNINLPFLAASALLRYEPEVIQEAMGLGIKAFGEGLFQKLTVGEFLWGYPLKELEFINGLTRRLLNKTYLPDKFGLFYNLKGNGTNDGVYTVYSGKTSIPKYNSVDKYHGSRYLGVWSTKYCDMVNGTDGIMFHPFVQKTDTLYYFSSDICRSAYFTYEREVSLLGVGLYKFIQPASVYTSGDINPDNKGFCTPDCVGSGMFNISSCFFGAPVMISNPHFYQAEQKYIDAMIGLQPNKEKHESFASVHPLIGVALDSARRYQINMYIRKSKVLRDTEKLDKMVFPMLWIDGTATMDDHLAGILWSEMLGFLVAANYIKWILVAVGIVLITVCILIYFYRRKQRQQVQVDDKKPIMSSVNDAERECLTDSIVNGKANSTEPTKLYGSISAA